MTNGKTEAMSDTPKFEVIDRRKFKAEEEHESEKAAHATESETRQETPRAEAPSSGPRLVVHEGKSSAEHAPAEAASAGLDHGGQEPGSELPPAPTAEESRQQKLAYDASAQRLGELIRAQNPAVGAQPPITFEHLVQQFYVSAMIQMGAGTQEGQRPRVDILGARGTIDLLAILAEKTRGNLTEAEDRMLQSTLFECRMAFLELSSMINMQGVPNPAPPPAKR
jgi:hypothetical protein